MKDLLIARSFYYQFLANFLFFIDDEKKFENIKLEALELSKFPISDANLADFECIKNATYDEFKNEQNSALFGFSYANVPLTASFYDEGRDNGRARIKVVNIMKKSFYRRDEEKCKEGEDYIGFIFELMATFLRGEAETGGENLSTKLFTGAINDFVDEFCQMLENAKNTRIYKAYANILQTFIALERSVLSVEPPHKEFSAAKEAMKTKPYKAKLKKNYEFD